MENLHIISTQQMQMCPRPKLHSRRRSRPPVWFNRLFLFLYGDRIGRQIGFKETYYLLSLSEYKGQPSVLSQRKQLSATAFVFPFSLRSTLSFQSLPVCESVAPLRQALKREVLSRAKLQLVDPRVSLAPVNLGILECKGPRNQALVM